MTTPTNRGWIRRAACVSVDPELFFPLRGQETAALAICRRCPVTQPCLDEALKLTGFDDRGIRGGRTETERDTLRPAAHRHRPTPAPPQRGPGNTTQKCGEGYGATAAHRRRGEPVCAKCLAWERRRAAQKREEAA